MRRLSLLLLLCACAPFAAGQNKEELKKLLELPRAPLSIGLNLDAWQRERALRKLSALQAELIKPKAHPDKFLYAGRLLREAGEMESTKEFFGKAVAGYEQLLKSGPLQPRTQENYIRSLIEVDRFPGAAKLIDERLKKDPKDARILALQAYMLTEQGAAVIYEKFGSSQDGGPAVPKAEELFTKASAAAKRAVEIDTSSADLYRTYADVLLTQAAVKFSLATAEGKAPPPTTFFAEAAGALRKAADLLPKDPLAFAEAFAALVSAEMQGPAVIGFGGAQKLGKQNQDYLAFGITQLTAQAGDEKDPEAGVAAEIAGVLLFLKGDPTGMVQWMKIAQAKQPNNFRVAEALMDSLLYSGNGPDAAAFAKRTSPDAPLSLKMKSAKALEAAGDWSSAAAIVEEGLKQQPSLPYLRLAKTVVDLKGTTANLSDIAKFLTEENTNRMGSDPALAEDFRFTRALFLALIGDAATAKTLLEGLKKDDPSETKYDRALKALAQSSPETRAS